MNPTAPLELAQLYPCWPELENHRRDWQTRTLLEAFQADPKRGEALTLEAAGLYLDYSKNHLNADTLALFKQLANQAQLPSAIADLLSGAEVNNTEKRPALHTALRAQGEPKTAEQQAVAETLARMEAFVARIHSGEWRGFNGDTITDVVHIGIGGSDLGPRMVTEALHPYQLPQLRVHFVANIDGATISDAVSQLNPASTLFIVASKSFSTLETLENAKAARSWILKRGCPEADIHRHFVSVSAKVDKAEAFGIDPDNVFPLWDWVGGRYSLWSAIGLPIALAVGMDNFNTLRAGAAQMDQHFAEAPVLENMPALLALITFWYGQFWGASSQAILPYHHRLHSLPAFLQQLDMESLGKGVSRDGRLLAQDTGLIIWGSEGTNGQHSFHQLLHQGSHCIPVDFIAALHGQHQLPDQHRQLFACCVSQSQALLQGKSLTQAQEEILSAGGTATEAEKLAPHKVIPGNRPSNTLLVDTLTPQTLGALLALYEHKVYCLSVLMQLNAFDQWGVELGKELGTQIDKALATNTLDESWDSSTLALLQRFSK